MAVGNKTASASFRDRIGELVPSGLPCRLDDAVLAKVATYVEMLQVWNRAINLAGKKSAEDIFCDLVCDSFYLAHFLDSIPRIGRNSDLRILDPGAGAGLPGIPLRLVWQKGIYTMVEIRQKRALFLANALANLDIPGTFAVHADVDNFLARTIDSHGPYHCIVSRAFRPWPQLFSLCSPHLASGGMLVIMAKEASPSLPGPWHVASEYSYDCGRGRRWFWALEPVTAGDDGTNG